MMTVGSKKMMCWSSYSLMAEWSLAYIGSKFLESALAGMETWGNEYVTVQNGNGRLTWKQLFGMAVYVSSPRLVQQLITYIQCTF